MTVSESVSEGKGNDVDFTHLKGQTDENKELIDEYIPL